VSETYRTLTERWGVLMSYDSVAEVMGRSPDGLRLSLAQNHSDWARALTAAKVKFGRRVHFRTAQIAQLIDGEAQAVSAAAPERRYSRQR
jgi:hypothetical protein